MAFDEEKLTQIVTNLLSNAIKFTPEGGQVYFTVKSESNQLILQMKDTGIGIAEAELPNIFKRFYLAKSAYSKEQGTGVGLALVQELVKLLQGQIEVESTVGKGTIFSVFIPLLKIGNEEKGLEPAVLAKPIEKSTFEGAVSSASLVQKDQILDGDKPILLIIEDNLDIASYLQQLLTAEYDLKIAYDGAEGVDKALELLPDLIISDVMMPKKDGFEVLEMLKADERTSHIPIVLLTAKAGFENRLEGLVRGADAYIPKPFDKRELFAVLKNLLALKSRFLKRYGHHLPEQISEDLDFAKEDAFLLKIRQIIEERIDQEWTVPQLCRKLNISRTQLHRKITALTGESVSPFITSIRLHKAKSLLKTAAALNISEIAYAVGFKDPNYFSKCFKDNFKISPTDFRNQ